MQLPAKFTGLATTYVFEAVRQPQFRVDLLRTATRPAVWDVIPAKAGIQYFLAALDSRLRGSDDRDALASLPLLTKT